MIVAMTVMGMVQAPIDQVADMVAMGHRFMAAARPVHMLASMAQRAVGERRASAGIRRADLDDMLIHMVFMGVMKMTVMEIIHMIAVLDGGVAAARSVDVIVIGVFGMVTGHGMSLSSS